MPSLALLPRRYTAIWTQIKNTGKCSIAAPAALHPRIIKAVLKEKWMDAGYKYELGENSKRAKMYISRKAGVITFTLIKSIGTDDI